MTLMTEWGGFRSIATCIYIHIYIYIYVCMYVSWTIIGYENVFARKPPLAANVETPFWLPGSAYYVDAENSLEM